MTNTIPRFRLEGPLRSRVEQQTTEKVRRTASPLVLHQVDDAVFWRVAYWIERYQLLGRRHDA